MSHAPSPPPPAQVGTDQLTWREGQPVEAVVDERDADGYADLRTYATIGDGRTIGLVARDGRIDWLPLPDLHSATAFGALLDADNGGHIALCPDEDFRVSRRYLEGTNVLETTFRTASGVVRVTDSLNTGIAGRLPWAELARRIDGVEGTVRLTGRILPGTCLNSASPWMHETLHGRVLRLDGLTLAPRTLEDAGVEVGDRDVTVRFVTSPGSRHLLGLVATEEEALFLPRPSDIDEGVDRTVDNWQRWSSTFSWDGP